MVSRPKTGQLTPQLDGNGGSALNLPNIITLLRIAAVPLAIWLILQEHLVGAFWVFVVAGLSDALDGFIAKRFNMETELGKYLDPIADKALLVSVYVTLGVEGHVASWLVILVVFRDLSIVGGALLFETMTHSLTMQPLMISKVNTATQIVFAAAVMASVGYAYDLKGAMDLLVLATAVTTVASGLSYAITWIKRWAQLEEDQK